MPESQQTLEKLAEVRVIRKLMRLSEVMLTMVQARYFLERMQRTQFEPTMNSIFEVDGNLLTFAISYGRAFTTAGAGRSILRPEGVFDNDQKLLDLHHEIMNFRDKKYAHNDDSLLPTRSSFFVAEGDHLVLILQLELGVPVDSYERYKPVIRRVEQHLFRQQETMLKRASEKIGREIRMPSGPPPEWAAEAP